MIALFGASWMTSAMGYLFAILAVVNETLKNGSALPHTVDGWISYVAAAVVAIMGRVARDGNVTSEAAGAR